MLRGYDQFMNVVLDHTQGLFSCKSSSESELSFNRLLIVLMLEHMAVTNARAIPAENVPGSKTEKNEIGMVVVSGNSIAMIECVDKVFG